MVSKNGTAVVEDMGRKRSGVGLSSATAVRFLQRWIALTSLGLLLSTAGLWIVGNSGESFPQVPLAEALCAVPEPVDWICVATLVGGLLWMLARPSLGFRAANLMVLGAGIGLAALNQHRLQPWFYQLLLFSSLFLLRDEGRLVRLLRWLVTSVYFFSAVGKLDFEFLHTVGQQFLDAATRMIGIDSTGWSPTSRMAMTSLLPLGELAIAAGLIVPRTQRIAGACASIFHGILIGILGPWGLGHSLGVLLWNLQFAVQALLLFVVGSSGGKKPADCRVTWTGRLTTAMVVLAMLLPLVERFGFWDHWPSWALYAPHSSRVEVLVARTAVDRLPASLHAETPTADTEALWVRVPISRWSLATLDCPVYPQARFQLGIARWLASELDSEFEIRAVVLGTASRWSGQRSKRQLEGLSEITTAGSDYWLNTTPRKRSR